MRRSSATSPAPKLAVGDVAFLEVTDVTDFGAFVDWGLPKELLVPFAEQTHEIAVGERHPIGVLVDESGRFVGTMKVGEMLKGTRAFSVGEWVDGEAWRRHADVGIFVIVEHRYVGLVPATEPHSLSRGQSARFRVASVLPDGKIELSLRGKAHEEMDGDAENVFAKLAAGSPPRVGDRSSPAEIRAVFGLSKKAFKRAVGRLLKQGRVSIDSNGIVVRTGG